MKKYWISFCMLFTPFLAFADTSSMSFTPPPTDYSMIFLGNIFGIVDGVLHGTGSQIMGNMFGVFNSAVLALGGIVVMYTLVVGTMNTAHEGQMLGQKWSSIWIPVRSTIGLALLIPKSSGYCLMQIFIMWVVVQGVGAADKIWNSALDYLNRGGSIMKAQMSNNSTTSSNSAIVDIATGAGMALSGQVCMYGVQRILEDSRENLLKNAKSDSGVCSKSAIASYSSNDPMKKFCTDSVPDFISTVDIVDEQSKVSTPSCPSGNEITQTDASSDAIKVPMPNFKDAPYSDLNGICGTLSWADYSPDLTQSSTLSCSDADTTKQTRAVALQQMFDDLTPAAMSMVDNCPYFKPSTTETAYGSTSNSDTEETYNDYATDQFGVPMKDTGTPCDGPSSSCTNWGPDDKSSAQAMLFTGFEIQNAISDYNGVMLPALNLTSDLSDASSANDLRNFIKGSEEEGWIMAGAYFFDLAYLNGKVTSGNNQVDKGSGLGDNAFNVEDLTNAASAAGSTFNTFLNHDTSNVTNLARLMDGNYDSSLEAITPTVNSDAKAVTNTQSSSTFAFITNGSLVRLPGQPGLDMPHFKMNFNMKPGQTLLSFPKKSFGCKGFMCMTSGIASLLYNDIFRFIINIFMSFITSTFNLMLQGFLYVPLTALMVIFDNGVQLLESTMVHPIIALAYMGSAFINASVDIWLNLITFTVIFSFLGAIVLIAVFMVLPFLASWLGVMVSVGWIDAYYVPFIPYMIFTFGSIAWLMAVIEAMVAGPIVALGVTHPEGHDALGKAEQSIMILVNLFLRPAMMIIGYIASISLSYVTIFILNSGFVHIMKFLIPDGGAFGVGNYGDESGGTNSMGSAYGGTGDGLSSPYNNWSAIYASFFCLVTYTSIYLTVVQKSFTLIHTLPDKVLRWIGSQGESWGQDAQQWTEDSKGNVKDAGEATGKSSMKTGGTVMGQAESIAIGVNKGTSGGSAGVS
ncbi:MAG: type IVB secretion system protein DotA [Legionellaceae bacterium]|nr:type IVB secretion system protein DotA [Legionellaceae bacterium]